MEGGGDPCPSGLLGLCVPPTYVDNMDALAEPILTTSPFDDLPCEYPGPLHRGILGNGRASPCPVFSLAAGSAALTAISATEADLLTAPGTPVIPGSLPAGCPGPLPCIVVTHAQLGLAAGDDIDAVCWFDLNENGLPEPPYPSGPDLYYFSLAPGSPTLATIPPANGGPASPADVLIQRSPTSTLPSVAITGGSLGLRDDRLPAVGHDNIDAMKCLGYDLDTDDDGHPDPFDVCPTIPTPWMVPPGDGDCDYWTDADEGTIGTDDGDPCANTPVANDEADDRWPADFDDNQTINVIDVLAMKPVFGEPEASNARFGLYVGPGNGLKIDIVDVLKLKPVFGTSCT